MGESEPEITVESDITVLDRQRDEFEQVAFLFRRLLTDDLDAEFGKWVLSPERGRFIVYTPRMGLSMGEIFVFFDDAEALLRHVMQAADAIGKAESRVPAVGLYTTPEIHERFAAALASTHTGSRAN